MSRKLIIVFFIIIGTICSFESIAQFFPDAAVQTSLHKLDSVLKPLVMRHASTLQKGYASPFIHYSEWYGTDVIKVMLLMSDSPHTLRSLGVELQSVIRLNYHSHGFLVTADLPVDLLPEVANMRNVTYIHAARQAKLAAPTLDISALATGANQVWESNPTYTGKNVVVGIIDTGIDWSHEDFKNPDGSSRILWIWDQTQTATGQVPQDFGYGTEWTQMQINEGTPNQNDYDGHGTHIASIAAGNGRGTGVQRSAPRFVGMAPEADIIVVKSYLFENEVLDAARYIFEKADSLGKPAVVNMSFAYQIGPHDGRTLLEQGLNQLVEETSGRAIVASAGNRGESTIHAGAVLLPPDGENYPKLIPVPDFNDSSTYVNIWYSSKDSISVRVKVPGNNPGETVDFEWVPPGQVDTFDIPKGPWEGATLIVDSQQQHPLYPDLSFIVIWLWNGGDISLPLDRYEMTIELDGPEVAFDAYYFSGEIDGGFRTDSPDTWLIPGDANKTIAMPSTARGVISVTSFVTRNDWVDRFGFSRVVDATVGEISSISSIGPSRDEEEKPNLAAPGEMIVGALAGRSWGYPPLVIEDQSHIALRGSSVAAAHVTGAVALMLQQEPGRTVGELQRLLIERAVDRGDPGWDRHWGAGQLNILASLDVPAVPQGFTAVAEDGSVRLSWMANFESNIAGYRLYISDQILDLGNVETFRLTDVQNGVPIVVSLSVFNTAGNESAKTRPLIVIPTANPSGEDTTSPTPPTGLIATPADGVVGLSWTANPEPDVAGYIVLFGGTPGEYFALFEAQDQTFIQVTGADNDVPLYAAVAAFDSAGNVSELSEEVEFTPTAQDFTLIPDQEGWPFQTESEVFSSPVLVDLDGDGTLEIIVGSKDGLLHVWNHDGSPVAGWPQETDGELIATPSVGDLDADGSLEIVLPVEQRVYIFRADGTPFNAEWPKRFRSRIVAAATLTDLDKDFDKEIIIVTKTDGVHVLHHDGDDLDGWPQEIEDYGLSPAAVGDLNRDASLELVVTTSGANVYAWEADGTALEGWPIEPRPGTGANAPPVLADMNSDGLLEIIVMFRNGSIYVLSQKGEVRDGWPQRIGYTPYAAPAVGDLNSDGQLEIIAGDLGTSSIVAFNEDGTLAPGWPISIFGSTVTSIPVLGDINGDDEIEVVVATNWGSFFGQLHAFSSGGVELDGWPLITTGNLQSSPAIGDLDNDGDIELCIGSLRAPDEDAFIPGAVYIWDLEGQSADAPIEWGMFQANPEHTGVYVNNLPPPNVFAAFTGKREFNQIRLNWTTQGEYGNLGWRIYRGEMPDGEFKPLIDAYRSTIDRPVEVLVKGRGYSNSERDYVFFDEDTSPLKSYSYYLENRGLLGRISLSPIVTIEGLKAVTIGGLKTELYQSFPNPGNPETWLPFALGATANVSVAIRSTSGELVRKLDLGERPAGLYSTKSNAGHWNGQNELGETVASGIYYYTFTISDRDASHAQEMTRRLVILK
jgi:subtilisin family serine protease